MDNTRAQRSTSASASSPSASGAATTSPATSTRSSCAWTFTTTAPTPLPRNRDPWLTNPSSSASRPPATRPASASSAGTPCSPTRSPPASTSTPASAASCPRSPRRAHLEAMVPTIERALKEAGVSRARPGRHRGHGGTRAGGRAARRRLGRQGVRVRAGQAALRRQPPRLPHLRRPAGARRAARADDGPAGLRRSLIAAAGPGHHRGRTAAGLDHRRRGRRGLRQDRPRARTSASPAARSSTGYARRATPKPSPSRAD